jgi:hypothetical protein
MQISLMPFGGMHSKAFAVWQHVLYDLWASMCLPFLNVHSTCWPDVETTKLSTPFHVSPG